MKQSKKTISGVLAAMILSLGVMGGIADSSLLQVGVACSYCAGETEGGLSNAMNNVGVACLGTASGMGIFGASTFYVSATTPVGWGYWIATGAVAL
ncbi:MAG: hypothetical protein LBJ17_04210 [Dysgonamonadaceae bacterium]|jgi:hypothetical protein|nr:hypothetical protein [Dysgonamonadaceae bacterium]